MSVTALIADDEPHLARMLGEQLVRLWPELELLPPARNGIEAAAAIERHQPTLAFLDIRMPGLTGLEVAQGIEGTTRVVFVTAYDEFAVQAFDQEALDYVLKPVTAERLARTVERLKRALAAPVTAEVDADKALAVALARLLPKAATARGAEPPLKWIRASTGELTHQIDVESIWYFQADDKYTVVMSDSGEHLIRTPIVEMAGQLDPQHFVQIHRSTIVNLAFVAGTRRDEVSRLFVRIRGNARTAERELPVSRAYVHLFKAM